MGYFLAARQHEDVQLSYRVIDSRGPWFLGASPLCIGLSAAYLAGAVLRLVAARLSVKPTITHINITGRGSTIRKAVLTALTRAIGLPYLLHVHDYNYAHEYDRCGRLMKWVIAGVFHGASKVIVLGAHEQAALSERLQLAPEQITVLHNAVPDPKPDLTRARPASEPCHLLFLGHLSERKGVPDLLRALASAALTDLQWRVTLAGDGPVEDYRQIAAELGIAQRVAFPGWVDQARVKALCAEADVLVLPSYAEGLAMAVLEGLSHGLAVVTTPVGAHSEVVEPEISGIFVTPGDVPGLTDAVVRIIGDEELRRRLRTGARRRFLERFEIGNYAEYLNRLHLELLSDRCPAALIRNEKAL